MRAFIALLLAGWAMVALAACQSDRDTPYDGVSRFAGSGFWDSYYGPASPPRDT